MGSTATLGLPYPENTDPLADMAAAIQALANAVDGFVGGAWQDWTPEFTGMTVGNGLLVARYLDNGATIRYRLLVVFGSTTTVSGGVHFSLPEQVAASENQYTDALVIANGGTQPYVGRTFIAAGTFDAYPYVATAAAGALLGNFGSFGMTMGAGSRLESSGTYERDLV
jgi:hypothetical protein